MLNQEIITNALKTVKYPGYTRDIVSFGIVKNVMVNAGAVSQFAADGVYGNYRDQGFFVIRQGGKLFALSAICTHRQCKLNAEPDRSFYCKCHGSTFDPNGHVTAGTARRDLPRLPAFPNAQGELLVKVAAW